MPTPFDFDNSQDLLAARALSKRHGSMYAIEGVSMTVRRGEILTLIGPNGAGKTTLLRLLLGLEYPDAGEVLRAKDLRIGYVPQHFAVSATMPLSVFDFLALSRASISGAAIAEVMQELSITHLTKHPLYGLSGGEMRRTLIARALLCQPNLLVLDEPVQGVDIAGQSDLYCRIESVAKSRNIAVLMVSHDLFVVMASTHRVLCLNRHVCCEGAPSHVGMHPAFVELFGADVATQLATYHHHHDHHHDLHGDVVSGTHGKGCSHV